MFGRRKKPSTPPPASAQDPSDAEDVALMLRAAADDADAFSALVRKHEKPLANFFARNGVYRDVEDLAQFGIGEPADQKLLVLGIHFHKGICRQLLREQTEEEGQGIRLHLFEHLRDIGRVHGGENIPQRRVLLVFKKHGEGGLQRERVTLIHRCFPPVFRKCQTREADT